MQPGLCKRKPEAIPFGFVQPTVTLARSDGCRRRPGTDEATNSIVRMLKLLFNFAVDEEWIKVNPLARMSFKIGKWRARTDEEECKQFEARSLHPSRCSALSKDRDGAWAVRRMPSGDRRKLCVVAVQSVGKLSQRRERVAWGRQYAWVARRL
jgi:hypothetical protein